MAQLSTNFSLLLLIAQTAFNVALPVIENTNVPCTRGSEYEDCRESFMHPNMPTDMGAGRRINQAVDTNSYWLETGKAHVAEKVKAAEEPLRGVAKNVIFFIGDGMSLVTQAATRIYLGGEEEQLSFEKFPGVGLAKTYSIDRLVPDSACTATAYLCGVKAMYGTIGVNGHVPRGDCNATRDENNHVASIAKWALDAGKSAGLVTTTRVTHASPAGVYAHVGDRDWEDDYAVRKACGGSNSGIDDIAIQLMQGDVGKRLKVIMGGGKAQFIDSGLYKGGKRTDGRNLIEEFVQQQEGNSYVETRQQLHKVDVPNTSRLLALFNDDHLLFNMEAVAAQVEEQPTLAEMTAKAIELLRDNSEGYFLFVEAGRIDMAHHHTKARLALDETAELSRAVEVAREMTNLEDTLIVVSADHSHTMSIAGYARRGNDIFGLASQGAEDEVPYLTLSYANGPSFSQFYDNNDHVRVSPLDVQDGTFNDAFPATAPMYSETHGGEDVGVFASGPWADLFNGVYEQSTIPHVMAYAAGLGNGLKVCGA